MKNWWLELSISEKRTILLGAFVSGLLLIYCFIWLPINEKIINTRIALRHTQTLLTWMQAADLQLKTTQKTAVLPPTTTSLASLMQDSLSSHTIAPPTQLHVIDSDTVQLSFKQIGFDILINWLLSLKKQGIEVSQMSVRTTDHLGIVETEFTLKKAN